MRTYYNHPEVIAENQKGQDAIRNIFDACIENPALLPKNFMPQEKNYPQKICDYIAGMTDTFALEFLK